MILLVGFDSAWTANNSGAIAAMLCRDDGSLQEIAPPQVANYAQAGEIVTGWQRRFAPSLTLILLDQPTIVPNQTGQRPVEHIVSSAVSARLGGMQPASISRAEMFGLDAAVWPFLSRFGGPANPLSPKGDTLVFETYPVLCLIAWGWTLPGSRAAGRLPKYNPTRRKTFNHSDWAYVCARASAAFSVFGLQEMPRWLDEAAANTTPRKSDQDCLDACLCLLAALHMGEGRDFLMVGDLSSGYIVAPHCGLLFSELEVRCLRIGFHPAEWVRNFRHDRVITGRGVTPQAMEKAPTPKPAQFNDASQENRE